MKNIKERKFLKLSMGQKIIYAIVLLLFSLYAISMIFPLIWLIMSSLKDSVDYAIDVSSFEPFALPRQWMFSNYVAIFSELNYKGTNFFMMFFNSIWNIVFTAIPSLGCATLFAYVMAKYNFKIKGFVQAFYLTILTLPIVGTGGAYYVFIKQLGLFDTPLYPLVTNIYCFSGHYLYMYACFKGISWSYAEAVFIDGGNHYTAFFKIMLPQALPVIGTLFLTMSIAQWNEYTGVLMYLPSYPTVASGLYQVSMSLNRTGITLYYTGLVVAMLPILLLYVIFADKLIKNLSIGGLKG